MCDFFLASLNLECILKPIIIKSTFSHNQVREYVQQMEQEWKERHCSHEKIKRNEASVIERKT